MTPSHTTWVLTDKSYPHQFPTLIASLIESSPCCEVAGTIPTDTRTDGCKMVGHIKFAWVRPNTGPYNPHTSIIQEDEKNVI